MHITIKKMSRKSSQSLGYSIISSRRYLVTASSTSLGLLLIRLFYHSACKTKCPRKDNLAARAPATSGTEGMKDDRSTHGGGVPGPADLLSSPVHYGQVTLRTSEKILRGTSCGLSVLIAGQSAKPIFCQFA